MPLLALGVHARGGFVEDVHLGVLRQCCGDHHASLLAPGEGIKAIATAISQAHLRQCLLDTASITAPGESLVRRDKTGADHLVNRYGHSSCRVEALGDVGEAGPIAESRDRRAEDVDLAAGDGE